MKKLIKYCIRNGEDLNYFIIFNFLLDIIISVSYHMLSFRPLENPENDILCLEVW